MSTVHEPDRWVIVRVPGDPPIHKVLAGWAGGYLWGDSWRLNSGITAIEETADGWDVTGSSGSVYRLNRLGVGMNTLMSAVLYGWNEQGAGLEVVDIEALA